MAKALDNSTEYYMALLKTDTYQLNSKVPYIHPIKTNNKSKNYLLGRVIINTCLPEDYPFLDEVVDKKKCSQLLADIANKYEPTITAACVTKLNKTAFDLATLTPITFNSDSFNVPPELVKRSKQLLNPGLDPPTFVNNVKTLGQEYIDWLKVNDNGLYDMVTSGAKMSPIDIGVLLFAKGPVVGLDGIISKPIMGCVNNGFDLKSFYLSADQTRSVYTIRSLGASEPGQLARETNYANCNIQLVPKSDCKTKKLLDLLVTPSIRKDIDGRWFLNETTGKLEQITQKTVLPQNIKIRSPIYCKQPDNNLCSVCYGSLGEKLATAQVGLLSGSIINKVGLNNYSICRAFVELKSCEFGKHPIRTIPSQA